MRQIHESIDTPRLPGVGLSGLIPKSNYARHHYARDQQSRLQDRENDYTARTHVADYYGHVCKGPTATTGTRRRRPSDKHAVIAASIRIPALSIRLSKQWALGGIFLTTKTFGKGACFMRSSRKRFGTRADPRPRSITQSSAAPATTASCVRWTNTRALKPIVRALRCSEAELGYCEVVCDRDSRVGWPLFCRLTHSLQAIVVMLLRMLNITT